MQCHGRPIESGIGSSTIILQRGVVGPPHGEKPLEGVSGIGVLHDALGLQVSHQQRDGLQELLLGELQAGEE